MTEFDWVKAAGGQPEPSTEGGESGYLSPPSATLDPDLFDGDTLRSDVAYKIASTLIAFLSDHMHLRGARSWLRIWLAGSGITYQWAAERGNSDLDVLLGVDWVKFTAANPRYAVLGEEDFASALNADLRGQLWPQTRDMPLGQHNFEVTYFYNSGTGTDITRIHPYAAYDVMKGLWVVRPPKLPHDPAQLYPRHWFDRANEDFEHAEGMLKRYREQMRALQAAAPGTPGHVNAGSALNLVTAQAQALFNDIHHGRRIAFQGGGTGYGDWHNFRWQMAKESGTVKSLSEISGIRSRAQEQAETDLYGGPLASADELVRRAAQRYGQ